jgi:cytochrome b subunit of formate dehydrogenase
MGGKQEQSMDGCKRSLHKLINAFSGLFHQFNNFTLTPFACSVACFASFVFMIAFWWKKVVGYHEEDDASRGQNTQVPCLLALLLLFS